MGDNKQQLLGQVKILITYFMGWLVGKHYVNDEVAAQLVGMSSIIIPMIIEQLDSMWRQRHAEAKSDARAVNAVNVGVTVATPGAPLMSPMEAKQAEAAIAPVIEASKGEVK